MATKAKATSLRAVRKSDATTGAAHLEVRFVCRISSGQYGGSWTPSSTLDTIIEGLSDYIIDDGGNLEYAAEAIELTPELFRAAYDGLEK